MPQNNRLKLKEDFPPVTTAEWNEVVAKDLKGDAPSKLLWKTDEGINVKPFYRAEDIDDLQSQLASAPGEFPFVRGAHATNDWSIRQTIDLPDPAQANAAARQALAAGAESIAFEILPEGAFLRGVAVQNAEDMRRLIKGLDGVPLSFRARQAARAILALYLAEVKEPAGVTGSIDFDPLGDLLLDGASSRTPQEIFADAAETLKFAAGKAPRLRTLAVRAGQYTEAGGTVVHEIAFALATGVEYLSELTGRGLSVDQVCSKIFFVFASGSNYFFQIAKLRAFRMMWAQAVAQFKPMQADSSKAMVESVTAHWGITAYAAHNNLLRGATEAMSAALGGSDSIEVTPFDAALKPSDDFSRRMARNTQVILKQEAYLDRVADPAGGSYYVESLTNSLAREAWKLFQEVETKGGLLKAMQSGFVQQEIANARRQKDEAIASRRLSLLGTNQYPDHGEQVLATLERNANVTALRQSASGVKPASSSAELARQFADGLALGECLAPGPAVFTVEKLTPYRGAEPFEALRLRTERHTAKTGRRPRVLLLEYGDIKMRKARVAFSSNFFAAAGFEIVPAFAEADAVAAAQVIAERKPDLVVLCSADQQYLPMARMLIEKLRQSKAVPVIVAGYPKTDIEQLQRDGVADFVHIRSNALQVLMHWQQQLEVGD
jgi:methylmalonyl-CoA mutase